MQERHERLHTLPRVMTPRYFTTGAGAGVSAFELVSFDRALREAGFADYNLLRVSSILPPFAEHRSQVALPEGSPLPTANGVFSSNTRVQRLQLRPHMPNRPTRALWGSLWRRRATRASVRRTNEWAQWQRKRWKIAASKLHGLRSSLSRRWSSCNHRLCRGCPLEGVVQWV